MLLYNQGQGFINMIIKTLKKFQAGVQFLLKSVSISVLSRINYAYAMPQLGRVSKLKSNKVRQKIP